MTCTVRLPEFLRRFAGGERSHAVNGATVGEVLRDVVRLHPELGVRLLDRGGTMFAHLVAFRNGSSLPREGLMATALGDGDVIEIHAAASGG
jgi:molybdopterin converting factor small subunit